MWKHLFVAVICLIKQSSELKIDINGTTDEIGSFFTPTNENKDVGIQHDIDIETKITPTRKYIQELLSLRNSSISESPGTEMLDREIGVFNYSESPRKSTLQLDSTVNNSYDFANFSADENFKTPFSSQILQNETDARTNFPTTVFDYNHNNRNSNAKFSTTHETVLYSKMNDSFNNYLNNSSRVYSLPSLADEYDEKSTVTDDYQLNFTHAASKVNFSLTDSTVLYSKMNDSFNNFLNHSRKAHSLPSLADKYDENVTVIEDYQLNFTHAASNTNFSPNDTTGLYTKMSDSFDNYLHDSRKSHSPSSLADKYNETSTVTDDYQLNFTQASSHFTETENYTVSLSATNINESPDLCSDNFVISKMTAYITIAVLAFILISLILILCIRIKCKRKSTSLDLSDIPHLALNVDDYKLAPIPRPSISFPETNRQFLRAYVHESYPRPKSNTILSQDHFYGTSAKAYDVVGEVKEPSLGQEMQTFSRKICYDRSKDRRSSSSHD